MKRQDYLGHNLNKLFKCTELKLHMPAERKANALNRLLQQAETPTEYERAPVPWIKYAAAAMVLLAFILGSISLMDKSGVAFADILENLQQRGYTFTYWRRQESGELKKIGRGMVLQPGLIRWDMPEDQWKGLAIVVDAINHKTRWVTTSGKDLGEIEMPKEAQDDPNLYQNQQNFLFGPVETLWGLVDGTEQSLGEATKDGIEVIGYHVEKVLEVLKNKGAVIYTIWANASTSLPHEVTMEIKDLTGENEGDILLLRDFDFDSEIDESLFGLGPTPEPEDVDEDKFIIQPGVGMVDLLLGADQAKIEEILGPPDFMVGEGLYQYTGLFVVAREGKVYAFHCGDGNKYDSRHVTECTIRTKEGIGMGSTGQEVINAYGQPDDQRNVKVLKGGSRWLYRSTGTIFGLYDGKVHYMIFQQPRQR